MDSSEPVMDAPARQPRLRPESVYRLQVGAIGLGAMLLLVSLANIIMDRARESDAAAVPDTVATVAAPAASEAPQDPLADTGVVPEVAPTPTPSSEATAATGGPVRNPMEARASPAPGTGAR
ncbi:hypothetical protein QQS45_02250 [Alteriqipengyuania flavescens]|uniref:hypothetical protein n=1 Tax=Alteriqipengyuania flavescens TaxID=3053610 RepID=UPI0025B5CD62|nr:hypothetical protein [Alteriqipengyuania flavescens]WJY19079.1 hypothetical protein QQW98_02245 [Alteriqipengyuania flavescens]WJY25020.1 hypothetical protein QQS45_02250 [Alteriqipengyuania flavescens]